MITLLPPPVLPHPAGDPGVVGVPGPGDPQPRARGQEVGVHPQRQLRAPAQHLEARRALPCEHRPGEHARHGAGHHGAQALGDLEDGDQGAIAAEDDRVYRSVCE